MKHYNISAKIEKNKTIFLFNATITEMYDSNTDSTEYELTYPDNHLPVPLTVSEGRELKTKAIEWLEAKKCSVCGQPEDDDGRCGCVNKDANA